MLCIYMYCYSDIMWYVCMCILLLNGDCGDNDMMYCNLYETTMTMMMIVADGNVNTTIAMTAMTAMTAMMMTLLHGGPRASVGTWVS